MKRIHLIIGILFAGVLISSLSSCMFNCVHGSGKQASETRKVADFSKLSISGGFKITLKQDSSNTLNITADDNLLKYIKTEITGSRLKIYTRKNICNSGEMTIVIGVKNLEEIKGSGAVELESDGKIKTQDLRFKLSGATKITMDLTAANVNASGSGATEFNLKGQASSLSVDLSGSGKVHALDFVVGDCAISSSGVGESEVNVLKTLAIHSSGASSVKYKGNPSITNDKSGASSVEKIN